MAGIEAVGCSTESIIKVEICAACNHEISLTLCSFHCPFDGEETRPAGKTVVRTYQRVDTLVSQEIR